MTHVASPNSWGLFSAAIAQSVPWTPATNVKTALELSTLFLAKVKCPPLTDAAHVACLRGLNVSTVLDGQTVTFPPLPGYMLMLAMEWTPVVVPNSNEQPLQLMEAIASGQTAPVPLLLGTTQDEMVDFLPEGGPPLQLSTPIPFPLMEIGMVLFFGLQQTKAIFALFNVNMNATDGGPALANIITDYQFTCPTRWASRRLNALPNRPTYQYMWRHVYSVGKFIYDEFPQCINVTCHTAELPPLFNNMYLWTGNPPAPTPEEAALTVRMQQYWTNTAKSRGDPNSPVTPAVAWLRGTQGVGMLNLDVPISMGPTVNDTICDYFDGLGYAIAPGAAWGPPAGTSGWGPMPTAPTSPTPPPANNASSSLSVGILIAIGAGLFIIGIVFGVMCGRARGGDGGRGKSDMQLEDYMVDNAIRI